MAQIHTSHIYDSALLEAQKKLFSLFESNSEKPILFLSSGGSAFELVKTKDAPKEFNFTLGVLDERFSEDPRVNNFAQLMETQFYKSCIDQNYNVFDTRVIEGDTLHSLEVRMNDNILTWLNENQDGVVIITQGMGPDGHTAGIMPDSNIQDFKEMFASPGRLVIGYDAGKEKTTHPLRVTVTLSFLQHFVDHAVCMISENEKAEAFENSQDKETKMHNNPFAVTRDMKDVNIYIFGGIDRGKEGYGFKS